MDLVMILRIAIIFVLFDVNILNLLCTSLYLKLLTAVIGLDIAKNTFLIVFDIIYYSQRFFDSTNSYSSKLEKLLSNRLFCYRYTLMISSEGT